MPKLEKLHPLCRLLYFLIILLIPIMFFNPYFSAVSLLCALLYSFSKQGKRAFKTVLYSFLAVLVIGALNMLFAHWGETVLFCIGHTAFYFESLVYGFNQGAVLASTLIWFTALGRCVDSESLLYLFRFSPKTALIFSMVLGFIPRFIQKSRDIKDARLALCGGEAPRSFKEKVKFSNENFSALVSYSLESSVTTSDSMQARGYKPDAVRASRFRFSLWDVIFIVILILSGFYIFYKYFSKSIDFEFQPVLYNKNMSISALVLFFILNLYPFIGETAESIKWKLLSVKA